MPDDPNQPIDESKSFSAPIWKKDLTVKNDDQPVENDDQKPVVESFDPAIDTGLPSYPDDLPGEIKPDPDLPSSPPPIPTTTPEDPPVDAPKPDSVFTNKPPIGDQFAPLPSLESSQPPPPAVDPEIPSTPEDSPPPLPEPDPAFSQSSPVSTPSLESSQPPPPLPPLSSPPLVDNQPVNGATNDTGPSFLSRFKTLGLALILVLFLIAAGYGFLKFVLPTLRSDDSATGGGKVTTLTYWGLWESSEIMKPVIADFENANPGIKINYEQVSKIDYRERLQSRLAKGDGPDIFRYHVTWVPMLAADLDSVPAEIVSAEQFETVFYPVVVDNLRYQGKFMGIPLGIDTLALFYNEDLFQKASITPPRDWNDFYEAAKQLTVMDGGQIRQAGAALGLTGNVEHWSDVLGLLMLQSGVDLSQPNTAQAESVLDYFAKFGTNRIWDQSLPSSTIAFASGKLAMYFGFSWDVFEIKEINPKLNFRVMPVPQLTENQVNWASFWVEGVSLKSKNKPEAWAFLQYLSQPEVLRKLYQQQGQFRLFGEPYARKDMAAEISTNPLVAPFVAQASQAQTWYLCSRTFDNGLNDRMIRYFEDAVNAVSLQNKSASDALKTVSAGVSQQLSRYQVPASF